MKNYFLALIVGATVSISCSKDNELTTPIPSSSPVDTLDTRTPGVLSFTKWQVLDQENNGNSSDLLIDYAIFSPLNKIDELRLLISKTALTSQEAAAITNYKKLPLESSYRNFIDINTTDTNNEKIVENQLYYIYILGLFKDAETGPALSKQINCTLKNEIHVYSPKLSGSFKATEDIAIGSDGSIYANGGSLGPDKIYKVTTDGVSTVHATGLNNPVGITIDSEDNLYATNFKNTRINKITTNGEISVFANDSRLAGGGGIIITNQNIVFNTFWASSTLYQITENQVSNFTTNSKFNGPVGVTYDKQRDKIYVSSFNNGKIFHVDNKGGLTEIADTPASIGHISYANDHFYITGWKEHKVYIVTLNGEIVSTIGTGNNAQVDGTSTTAQFTQPNGIEATPNGKYVYVTQGNGNLRKIILPRK